MDECFKCSVSGDKTRLFDAVSPEGIVKICGGCSFNEDWPLVKKPTEIQLQEAERKTSVRERLSRAAGIRPDKRIEEIKSSELRGQDISLRQIIDKNYRKSLPIENIPRRGLVHNFHWMIMGARRKKHISQKQFAEAIGESDSAILMAEQGRLPEHDNLLITKIENFLGINLRNDFQEKSVNSYIEPKKETRQEPIALIPKRILNFKQDTVKNLKIADLVDMRKTIPEEEKTPAEMAKEKLFNKVRENIEISDDPEHDEIKRKIKKTLVKRGLENEEENDSF
ncbi:MAG: helix-turn-helix domain-containing protein [Nanoarchaeota archaeon]